jgi:hypothetical protein
VKQTTTQKTNYMKTRILLAGVVIAAISAFSLKAKAQVEPSVKIVPGLDSNTIKLIFGYETTGAVNITFSDADGVISSDRLKGNAVAHGFIKKYEVNRAKTDAFWVRINSKEVALTYKLTAQKDGKWAASLEQGTYNFPTVASR